MRKHTYAHPSPRSTPLKLSAEESPRQVYTHKLNIIPKTDREGEKQEGVKS